MMGDYEKMYGEYVIKYIKAEKEKVDIILTQKKTKKTCMSILKQNIHNCFRKKKQQRL
jgi:hypothetical protein